jgi:hypothetical protein
MGVLHPVKAITSSITKVEHENFLGEPPKAK